MCWPLKRVGPGVIFAVISRLLSPGPISVPRESGARYLLYLDAYAGPGGSSGTRLALRVSLASEPREDDGGCGRVLALTLVHWSLLGPSVCRERRTTQFLSFRHARQAPRTFENSKISRATIDLDFPPAAGAPAGVPRSARAAYANAQLCRPRTAIAALTRRRRGRIIQVHQGHRHSACRRFALTLH